MGPVHTLAGSDIIWPHSYCTVQLNQNHNPAPQVLYRWDVGVAYTGPERIGCSVDKAKDKRKNRANVLAQFNLCLCNQTRQTSWLVDPCGLGLKCTNFASRVQ